MVLFWLFVIIYLQFLLLLLCYECCFGFCFWLLLIVVVDVDVIMLTYLRGSNCNLLLFYLLWS